MVSLNLRINTSACLLVNRQTLGYLTEFQLLLLSERTWV